jgi:POT family proton-dependent oligopeptide transporter
MKEVLKKYWDLFISSIKSKLSLLDDSPFELYLTFLLVFCDGYGYFCVSQILVIFLHEEYDVSDMNSGTIYGLWLASITFWGMIASCFNDYLGVRKSLLIGFSISMISNISLAFSSSLTLLYVILFGILPIGNSMGIPMLTIGIKRYTKKANRGFAYGLFYAIMNIAALVSGPVIDFFNVLICPANSSCSSTYRRQAPKAIAERKMRLLTGNRLVLWTVAVIYVFAWC